MKNEITVKPESLVSLIDEKGVSEVIRPLVKEIHLFDTYVAGTSHLKDPSPLAKVKPDDKLILVREENRFDDNAIVVMNEAREKLGYVPEKDNIVFSRLMDAGKCLSAKVISVKYQEYFTKISISIYLADY